MLRANQISPQNGIETNESGEAVGDDSYNEKNLRKACGGTGTSKDSAFE